MFWCKKSTENMLLLLGRRFIKDESGATAIEYAVVITLIAVTLVSSATLLGEDIINKIAETTTAVGQAETP